MSGFGSHNDENPWRRDEARGNERFDEPYRRDEFGSDSSYGEEQPSGIREWQEWQGDQGAFRPQGGGGHWSAETERRGLRSSGSGSYGGDRGDFAPVVGYGGPNPIGPTSDSAQYGQDYVGRKQGTSGGDSYGSAPAGGNFPPRDFPDEGQGRWGTQEPFDSSVARQSQQGHAEETKHEGSFKRVVKDIL